MFDPFKTRDSRNTSLHDAPAWSLLVGETYSSAVQAQARQRPHRGMLPDVDYSRAVSVSRPSLLRRIVLMARASNEPTGSSDDPVGEMPNARVVLEGREQNANLVRPLAA